jgi:hypothetical protein
VKVTRRQVEQVARSYDPSILDLPEPNPVSVMAYLDRLKDCYLRVCHDLAKERAMVSEWTQVVDKAASMWPQEEVAGVGRPTTPAGQERRP